MSGGLAVLVLKPGADVDRGLIGQYQIIVDPCFDGLEIFLLPFEMIIALSTTQ